MYSPNPLALASGILLRGLISRPHNIAPRDQAHVDQVVTWAKMLELRVGGNPDALIVAAEIMCGYLVNVMSAHCTPDQLFEFAIDGATRIGLKLGAASEASTTRPAPGTNLGAFGAGAPASPPAGLPGYTGP